MIRKMLLAVVVFAGACGSDSDPGEEMMQQGIPLQTWVHSLVTERMADDADPDTVEDKVIIDTEDEAAFDVYLQ